MSPKDYASVLQSISSSLLPFLQDDGMPSLPPFAWLAAFNGSLFIHQVLGGRESDMADMQKNCMHLDILGKHGEQHLDLSVDGVHSPLDTMPCATMVQVVCKYLEELVASPTLTEPSPPSTGTGK